MSEKATKTELEEQYSLDDAIKLSALWQMQTDIAEAKKKENEKEMKN